MSNIHSLEIIILAGGAGTRMQSETPKVLSLLHGKPLIVHLLLNIAKSGVCDHPTIIVGQKREQVMTALGDGYRYVVQGEQLGTGHAVKCAEQALKDAENVLVLYGDQPYTSSETIKLITETHAREDNDMTMATVSLPDFKDWRESFMSHGRVARDAQGKVSKIIYGKNLTEAELAITEVDPALFCFKASWLWPSLAKLKNENSHAEYYLTDLVSIAVAEGAKLGTVSIEPKDAVGVNTKQHLELIHSI